MLSVQEIEEKIKRVEEDMRNMPNEKGREALSTYLEYLRDELKQAKGKQ